MLLSFSCVFAQEGMVNDKTNNLTQAEERYAIELLTSRICGYFASESLELVDKTRKAIMKHMREYEGIENPNPKQIIEFLNRNKHFMYCPCLDYRGIEGNMNYMMVSFEHGNAYDWLFNKFFVKELVIDRENFIDINAISYTCPNGTPETVLDYMIRRFKDPATDSDTRLDIERLIRIFTKSLGAKKYNEISEAEKQEF